MLVSAKDLGRYALRARDGAVGRVHEIRFEEEGWGVEHLVAVAGNLLFNRLVLIDVEHLYGADRAHRVVRVDLARSQVRDGPGTGARTWAGYRDAMTFPHPSSVSGNAGLDGSERARRPRSTAEVTGYRVLASDGEAGRVQDFVVDAEGWRIQHVVVGARGRYCAERVLLDPARIERVVPEARTVHVGLTGKEIWGARQYAGYEVRDPRGVRIGVALEVLANGDAEPGYVRVSMGFLAGFLRPRTVLIPAQMVLVDEVRRVLMLH